MIDYARVEQFYNRGYCTYEGLLSGTQCAELRAMLDEFWHVKGSPDLTDFGLGVHPLCEQIPETAGYLANAEVIETVSAILQDDVRLLHTGARLSEQPTECSDRDLALFWHNHYSWDAGGMAQRQRAERLLFGVYVDGSSDEVGNLVVLPRRIDDPLGSPLGGSRENWPGQVDVVLPPGSFVIFDTALWHTAKRGTKPGIRHLIGTHCQGWSDTRNHPEDNYVGSPELDRVIATNSVLKSLLVPAAKSGLNAPDGLYARGSRDLAGASPASGR